MSTAHYSYKGKGRIHIRKKVTGALWREIGNCSSLDFSVEETTEEMQDYRDAGGGVMESDTQISSVKGAVSCYNMSPENIALGLRGIVTTRPAADIEDEEVIASFGSVVPLARLQVLTEAMTVKNTAGTVTYEAGEDYTRTRAGIVILTGGDIVADQALKVTYKAQADSIIQAMAAASDDYEIMFDGLNDARSGRPVRVLCHKNKWSPTKGLGLITDGFGSQELEFTVLSDDTKTGNGVSRYMTVEVANV